MGTAHRWRGAMGKKGSKKQGADVGFDDFAAPVKDISFDDFADALRRQLANRQRVVRVFDVGGSGIKTALFSAVALREFLQFDADRVPTEDEPLTQLCWIEAPSSLGSAPGEDGLSQWLLHVLPRLRREVDDPNVCFGVSVGGDVDHGSGAIQDWWPRGGHPKQWDDGRANPLVSEMMGLPPARTFAIHDGEAHLLGCSRCAVPPPCLGCFAIGTGVGFGLTDSTGAAVDPCSRDGSRSLWLNGVPLSGAPYKGIWKQWLKLPLAGMGGGAKGIWAA